MLTKQKLEELVETALATTELSLRTVNVLEEHGMLMVGELLECCGHPEKLCDGCEQFVGERKTCGRRVKLMEIPNFGVTTLAEVFSVLEGLGLDRSPEHPTLRKRRKRRKKRARRG